MQPSDSRRKADEHHIELDTFSKESDIMWRGFVISVIAAVSLQYVDPFGTNKLVLFEVRTGYLLLAVFC